MLTQASTMPFKLSEPPAASPHARTINKEAPSTPNATPAVFLRVTDSRRNKAANNMTHTGLRATINEK